MLNLKIALFFSLVCRNSDSRSSFTWKGKRDSRCWEGVDARLGAMHLAPRAGLLLDSNRGKGGEARLARKGLALSLPSLSESGDAWCVRLCSLGAFQVAKRLEDVPGTSAVFPAFWPG